jgi:hypothetical protein
VHHANTDRMTTFERLHGIEELVQLQRNTLRPEGADH